MTETKELPVIAWKCSKHSNNRSTELNAVVFPTIDGDVGWWAEKIGGREIVAKGRKPTIIEAVRDAEEFLRSKAC